MTHRILKSLLLALTLASPSLYAGSGIAIIAHSGTPKLDSTALKKLFMGRLVEVDGVEVIPVNQPLGANTRSRFMQSVIGENDEKYVAYWTVRRYIGKGAPPKELNSDAEVISFVQNTPGAIGYISENNARPGVTVLLTR